MDKLSKYVGLDVHKDTIAVAVADAGRGNSRFYGTIENTEAYMDSSSGASTSLHGGKVRLPTYIRSR